jgi:hypothetical protein
MIIQFLINKNIKKISIPKRNQIMKNKKIENTKSNQKIRNIESIHKKGEQYHD